MIQYLNSSVFKSPAQTLVNTVNTVGVMGKGVALGFRQIYPEMYEEYRRLCADGQLTIGKLYVYRTENKIIVNFPTKVHWRNPSKLDYIEKGLAKFVDSYSRFGISSVSFPQLGCGNGELDWESQVRPLMELYLHNLAIPVFIHLYTKPASFVPERLDATFAREMRLARKRVSADQLWADLALQVTRRNGQQSIDQRQTISVDDEHICFRNGSSDDLLYREDVEDLWAMLGLRKVITTEDVSRFVTASNPTTLASLVTLLTSLPYIRPVTVSRERNGRFVQEAGIQYSPEPGHIGEQRGEVLA
jgi:O-acetyl-ADP-ribose deacetylase (regulator of RNase III)